MKTILYTWFAVLLFGMAAVSCGDDDTKNNDTTGITGSSWKASETVGADRTTKKYTFKASANWVAQSDKPEWCKILTSSGDKGSDRQLNISVEANETGSTRSANITVQVSGYARAAQFAITQLGSSSGGTGADTELNKQVDKILEYYYLWNGEYQQMSRDLSLDYISSSDNFLKRTLLEMTTNDLDKKRQSNGSYSVYSYLMRTPLTKAVAGTTRGVSHGVVKEKEYGFGIAGLMGVRFVDGNNQPTGEYGLVVTSVYPDSPASEAGFRRGTFFAQYNGAAITAANLNSVYGTLIAPGGASTVKLTENKQGAQPVSLTAREIYPNPVIHSEVITSGAHRIGYLVYDSFDAAYDDELLAAVKKLKDGNITDMVLDLRNNGGGHVISSNMLSTCIAGAACQGKVYEYYRYNDSRMATVEKNGEGDRQGVRHGGKKILRRILLRRLLRRRPAELRAEHDPAVRARYGQHGLVERSRHQYAARVGRLHGEAHRRKDQRQERRHGGQQIHRRQLQLRTGPDIVPGLQRQAGDRRQERTGGRHRVRGMGRGVEGLRRQERADAGSGPESDHRAEIGKRIGHAQHRAGRTSGNGYRTTRLIEPPERHDRIPAGCGGVTGDRPKARCGEDAILPALFVTRHLRACHTPGGSAWPLSPFLIPSMPPPPSLHGKYPGHRCGRNCPAAVSACK